VRFPAKRPLLAEQPNNVVTLDPDGIDYAEQEQLSVGQGHGH